MTFFPSQYPRSKREKNFIKPRFKSWLFSIIIFLTIIFVNTFAVYNNSHADINHSETIMPPYRRATSRSIIWQVVGNFTKNVIILNYYNNKNLSLPLIDQN